MVQTQMGLIEAEPNGFVIVEHRKFQILLFHKNCLNAQNFP